MPDLTSAFLDRHHALNAAMAHNQDCVTCWNRRPLRCDDGADLARALADADQVLRDTVPAEWASRLLPRTPSGTAGDYWRYLDAWVRDGDPKDLARMAACVTPLTVEQVAP